MAPVNRNDPDYLKAKKRQEATKRQQLVQRELEIDKSEEDYEKKTPFLRDIVLLGGKGIETFKDIGSQLNTLKAAFGALANSAKPFYDSLIQSNELLNANILKQQTFIAQTNQIFDASGREITNISAKIDASRPAIRKVLADLQKDSQELVGVTSTNVTDAFGIVLRNSGKISGQYTDKVAGDVLEASRKLTKGLVAGIGTIGLPTQQYNQEITSLLQGRLNDPNSQLIKSLNISRTDFDRARASGQLVDYLIEKLEPYTVANKKAALSISGITSNIQDFVEVSTREAGRPLLDPIIKNLKEFQEALPNAFVFGDALAKETEKLVPGFDKILGKIKEIGIGVVNLSSKDGKPNIDLGGAGKTLDIFGDALGIVKDLGGNIFQVTNPTSNLGKVSDGLGGITEVLPTIRSGFLELRENIDDSLGATSQSSAEFSILGRQLETLTVQTTLAKVSFSEFAKIQKSIPADGTILDLPREQQKRYKELASQLKTTAVSIEETKKDLNLKASSANSLTGQGQIKQAISEVNLLESRLKTFKEEVAKEQGISPTADEDVRTKAKKVTDKGELIPALQTELKGQLRVISEGAGGDEPEFTRTAKLAIELAKQLKNLNNVSLDQYIKNVKIIRDNRGSEREIRVAAQKSILDTVEQESQQKSRDIKSQISLSETARAKGEISSGENDINKLKVESQAIASEIKYNQIKLREAKAFGDKFTTKDLEIKISELREKAKALPSQIVDRTYDEQNLQLDRNLARAEGALKAIKTARDVELAKAERDGLLDSTGASEQKAVSELLVSQKALEVAAKKTEGLERTAIPLSQDKKYEREKKIQDAKLAQLSATEALIRTETTLEQATRARITNENNLKNQSFKLELSTKGLSDNRANLEGKISGEQLTLRKLIADEESLISDRKTEQANLLVLINGGEKRNQKEILTAKQSINTIDEKLIQNARSRIDLAFQEVLVTKQKADLGRGKALTEAQLGLNTGNQTTEEFESLRILNERSNILDEIKQKESLLERQISTGVQTTDINATKIDLAKLETALAESEYRRLGLSRTIADRQLKLDETVARRKILLGDLEFSKVRETSEKKATQQAKQSLESLAIEEDSLKRQIETNELEDEGLEKQTRKADLENKSTELQTKRIQGEREYTDSILNAEITRKERSLDISQKEAELISKRNNDELAYGQLKINSIERENSLLSAQADLVKAQSDGRIYALKLADNLISDNLKLQQSLDKAGVEEKRVVLDILASRGAGVKQTLNDILLQDKIKKDTVRAELEAKEKEIANKLKLAEIEKQQADLSAKRLTYEAQAQLTSLNIEKQKLLIELKKTELLPDEQRVPQQKILSEAITQQENSIALAGEQLNDANAQGESLKTVARLKTQILDVTSQTSLKEAKDTFKLAENNIRLETAKSIDGFNTQTNQGGLSTSPGAPQGNTKQTLVTNTYNFANSAGARPTIRALGL